MIILSILFIITIIIIYKIVYDFQKSKLKGIAESNEYKNNSKYKINQTNMDTAFKIFIAQNTEFSNYEQSYNVYLRCLPNSKTKMLCWKNNDILYIINNPKLDDPNSFHIAIDESTKNLSITEETDYNKIPYYDESDTEIFHRAIPISNIQYYKIEGEVSTSTNISGGGGGGSSIGGAIVGGVLAGGAGAVIGSRRSVDPITSQTVTKDNRYVDFVYRHEENKIDHIEFTYSSYETFKIIIPEKDYNYLLVHQNATKDNNVKDRLIKLKELKDNGLIDDDEYETRRNKILEEI